MPTRRFVTLDLETVPDEALVAAVDGEPGRPYPEQLRRLLAERKARSGGRSDFLPIPFHRPVAACLLEAEEGPDGVRVTDASAWTDRAAGADEAAFLRRTWQRLAGRSLVTFHGRGFDLPVLELRSLKLGVRAGRHADPGHDGVEGGHLDLVELLSHGRAAPVAPLDLYAKLVGLPGKDAVAGADVQALYADGALDRIAAYCMTDVIQTWLLFLRWRLVEGSLERRAYEASVCSARDELPAILARRLAPGEHRWLEGWLDRCSPFFGAAQPPRLSRRRAG